MGMGSREEISLMKLNFRDGSSDLRLIMTLREPFSTTILSLEEMLWTGFSRCSVVENRVLCR